MKNQFIIPSIIIAAAILGGFWMFKPPSKPQKVIVVEEPYISIHKAARRGDIEAVKKHLAFGTDLSAKDENGCTPLHTASNYHQHKIVKLLIAKGADVNAKDNEDSTPLDLAVYSMVDKIDKLYGSLVVELLIAEGADVNYAIEGETLLDFVISEGDKETAELLRKYGGKSGAKDSIHVAAQVGNIEAVKLHLAAGTDVNAKSVDGWTPLHNAGTKEIAEFLIANGADVNAETLYELTPLHLAATHGRKEIAELLIRQGADVNAQNEKGKTPLDSAIGDKQTEVADLLRKLGGKSGEELKAEGK